MTEPLKHHGYGNALVFDLATWRGRIPSDAIVPGCVGPLTFGKTRGLIVYIWDQNPPVGEQRIGYTVPKRLADHNKIPQVSDYDPREYTPVSTYLRRFKRAKDPAAVAASVSWHRSTNANRHELPPPSMVDVDDAEFYCYAHDRQSAALPYTPRIAAEEAALKTGYRKRSKYRTAFSVGRIYVTSACDTEVYARLFPRGWTQVAASCIDVRSPETATALHALGLASRTFLRWVSARDVSNSGTHAGYSNIAEKINDRLRPDEHREPWNVDYVTD